MRRNEYESLSCAWAAVACVLLTATLLTGCRGASPTPTRIDRWAPEKDVLHYRVQLPEPVPPESYRSWSEAQIQKPATTANPDFPQTEIYEVFYSFYRGTEKLASVHFRRGSESARADTASSVDDTDEAELQHVRTLVYSVMP